MAAEIIYTLTEIRVTKIADTADRYRVTFVFEDNTADMNTVNARAAYNYSAAEDIADGLREMRGRVFAELPLQLEHASTARTMGAIIIATSRIPATK